MEYIPCSLQGAKHLRQKHYVIWSNFGPGRHDMPRRQFENAVASSPQKLHHELGRGVRSPLVFGGYGPGQFTRQKRESAGTAAYTGPDGFGE